MEHYYFSGGLTREMADLLKTLPDFQPIDVLVSQLDRSSIKQMIEYQSEGIVKQLFIDSGAFSVHTGKAKVDLEEYIEYVNSIDDHIHAVAQVDTIPGTFGKSKSPEDYKRSAELSWENFLYMYYKMKSPEKLIPVFHYGESFDVLRKMLAWKDKDGNPLRYIGISPANDSPQKVKNIYMQNVYDIIKSSENPNVHTHLFGMTALDALSKFPAYSADSISHRLIGAYNKILVPKYGVISISNRVRSTRNKSSQSFVHTADDSALSEVNKYIEGLGFTLEQAMESHSVRCVITMNSIMKTLKENPYKPTNVVRAKKLFKLPN